MAIFTCTPLAEAAVTLFTSEMLREAGATTSPLFCSVVNVGSVPISGTVKILRPRVAGQPGGSVAVSTPVTNLLPLDIQGIGLRADPPNFPSGYFCRIDVDAKDKNAVRGSLMLLDANGRTLVSIEAQ